MYSMGKKTESKRRRSLVEDHTPQISLSLKDLERLGVIKKKLKRKRKNKKLTKVLDALIGGSKGDSSHMRGYTNHFANTSNLTTEHQRLQNSLLGEAQEKHRKELLLKDAENESYKHNIHNALSTLYDAYKNPYQSNYTIEELPDEEETEPKHNRFTELKNRQNFYDIDDNIDVPRTDGSQYTFKGEPVPEESVAHQSLDTLKTIEKSLVGGGGLNSSPRTPKSDEGQSKQSSIFSMFSGIRSPQQSVPYSSEKIFSNDNQKVSPVKENIGYENPMLKKSSIRGISPRASQLKNLKDEAISLGIPDEDVIHETRQDVVKKLINRHKVEQKRNDELRSLVKYYVELSGRLNEPTNSYLLDSPSSQLLKSAIKKLQTTAKKNNINID